MNAIPNRYIWLVQKGTPLFTVAELMGHTMLTLIRRYAHLSPESMRKAAMSLEGNLNSTLPKTDSTLHNGERQPDKRGACAVKARRKAREEGTMPTASKLQPQHTREKLQAAFIGSDQIEAVLRVLGKTSVTIRRD